MKTRTFFKGGANMFECFPEKGTSCYHEVEAPCGHECHAPVSQEKEARKEDSREEWEKEAGDIVTDAIWDGQNQIHDLRSEKATADEITVRMNNTYKFCLERAAKLIRREKQSSFREGIRFALGKVEEATFDLSEDDVVDRNILHTLEKLKTELHHSLSEGEEK